MNAGTGQPSNAVTGQPSALEWLTQLRAGELSARELAEHYLDLMGQADKRLHAVVACEPDQVLARADAADRRRAAGGEMPPLLGLPVTVKDSIEVAGLRCTGGSVARRNYLPEADATVVRRIRAAGALVLAKTNVPELSCSYETDNAVHGRTNHPLDQARTPGGSTGGEAALLGADASPLGLGTDGGGSIRLPAHYCGLVGLRPTAGRVPATGIWPPTRASGLMDIMTAGPIGRTVADVALLAEIISGPDEIDFYARPAPFGDYREVPVRRLRVGWYAGTGPIPVSPGTRDTLATAAAALAEAGAEVRQVTVPALTAEATELFFAASGADGGAAMRSQVADAGGVHHPQFVALLESLPNTEPAAQDWFDLQQRIFEFRAEVRRWMADYDALLAPVCTGPAPRHGQPPYGVAPADYLKYLAHNDTHVFSVAGVPALSVPVGTEHGLPVGVQIAARAWREDVALALGAVLENTG